MWLILSFQKLIKVYFNSVSSYFSSYIPLNINNIFNILGNSLNKKRTNQLFTAML